MGNLEFLKSKITKFTENGQNQCQRNDVQEKSKSEANISRKLQNPYVVCTHFQSRSCSRQLVTSKLKKLNIRSLLHRILIPTQVLVIHIGYKDFELNDL